MAKLQAVAEPGWATVEYRVGYGGMGYGWQVLARSVDSLGWFVAERPYTTREQAEERVRALTLQECGRR